MGRPTEISAQTSMVDSFQAALNRAEWRLDQRSVVSPDARIVADVLAQRGETLAAGAPMVSLLPPEKDLRVLLHPGVPTRARPRRPESRILNVITVRRTWAGPFPSLRRRPNMRPPSSIPNRTAASSSFSPKRGCRRRGPRYSTPASQCGDACRRRSGEIGGFLGQTEAAKRPRSACCPVY